MSRKIFFCLLITLTFCFGQVGHVVGAIHELPYKGQGFALANNNQSFLIPKLLNYQGYLTDNLGNPTNNPSLSMTFAIYDASSSGTQLWTEDQTISVSKGIFNATLGSVAAIPNSVFRTGTDRWLELVVGGQTLTPRTRITSMGYAYTAIHSDTAEYAKNAAADNDWVISGNDMYSGVSGNVGIGTTTPRYKLDVNGVICGGTSDTVKAVYGGVLSGYGNLAGDAAADTAATVTGGWDNSATGKFGFVGGGRGNTASGTSATVGGGYADTASGDYTIVGGGLNNTANTIYATVCGGRSNHAGGNSATVSGGYDNTASGYYATVGGGYSNEATYLYATVSGGYNNTADTNYATVGGGFSNTASGTSATVAGGYLNIASGYRATVGGGYSNLADSSYAFIGGGYNNTANGNYATVAGGSANIAGNSYATVSGGTSNEAESTYATVGGGFLNRASGTLSTVGGGMSNTASGNYATVGGGWADTAMAPYSGVFSGWDNNAGNGSADTGAFVGGGRNNRAIEKYAAVSGGYFNTASNIYATVGGGVSNTAEGWYTTVGGGEANTASGQYATVGGGRLNTASGYSATVGGGQLNTASGYGATVGGGYGDTAAASNSFATNVSTKVLSGDVNSAAFTTSHTTAANQVRAASFSTGFLCFTMDHPDNPTKEILNQYSVGADDPILIYNGTAYINADGRVEVNLPDYFDKINRNPRIQLTGVGTYEVYVAEKIKGNVFVIGGKPNVEVYWQVTAERKDIHAEIARTLTPVEQPKTGGLINHSLDDDALIGVYDGLNAKKPGTFAFKTEEGRSVHEQTKRIPDGK